MTIDYELEPVQKPKLNPWFSMWTKPRATIAQIIEDNPEKHVKLLAGISGIIQTIGNATGEEAIPPGGIIFAAVIFGPIAGIISLLIATFGLTIVGGWLGGKGTTEQVKAALAWANVPQIWMGPVVILLYLLVEPVSMLGHNLLVDIFTLCLFAIYILVGIWNAVIYCKCLGEAHGFSAWRAWATYILAVLIVSLPILGLLFLFA